jgi:hypothetical protein
VDQTAPADQSVLRDLRERGENPGLDGYQVSVRAYVLVAILKKRLGLPQSLYTILQVLSVTLFEQVPVHQALVVIPDTIAEGEDGNQVSLFDR